MIIRISISGNLYFANVEEQDKTDGDGYVCIVNNKILRSLSKGDNEEIYPIDGAATNQPSTLPQGVVVCAVFCETNVEAASITGTPPGGATAAIQVSKMVFSVIVGNFAATIVLISSVKLFREAHNCFQLT